MAAFHRIEDFVGKVAAEKKGLPAAFVDGRAQAVVVAVKADEDSPCAELLAEIFTGFFPWQRAADEFAVDVELNMAGMIRAVEAVHHERHPGRAAFEKCDAQFRKAVEHAVREHGRGLDHQTERVAESVRWIIC